MCFKKIDIDDIKKIAIKAGKEVLKIYNTNFHIEYKKDKSPLTNADLKANEIICSELKKIYPNIPLMSEENKQIPYDTRKNWECYFCIDPVDGTKEFIKKSGEFTVNIALICKNIPVLGVVFAPVLGELYYAKKDENAFKEVLNTKDEVLSKEKLPIVDRSKMENSITIVTSKPPLPQKTEELVKNIRSHSKTSKLVSKGSSLKLCMVATGEADISPKIGDTMEWDTAAADAILRESGKRIYQYHPKFNIQNPKLEKPLLYNKQNLLNPSFIVK